MTIITVPIAINRICMVLKSKGIVIPAGETATNYGIILATVYHQLNKTVNPKSMLSTILDLMSNTSSDERQTLHIQHLLKNSYPALTLYLQAPSTRQFYATINGFDFEDLQFYSLTDAIRKTENLHRVRGLEFQHVLIGEDVNHLLVYNAETHTFEKLDLMNYECQESYKSLAELLDHSYNYVMETSLRNHR